MMLFEAKLCQGLCESLLRGENRHFTLSKCSYYLVKMALNISAFFFWLRKIPAGAKTLRTEEEEKAVGLLIKQCFMC